MVAGEEFGFNVDYEVLRFKLAGLYLRQCFKSGHMMYVFYGSLALLLWKCGTQLLKEARYKALNEEEDIKKKAKMSKGSKYQKILY